ncbi:MAG: hypothetical protein K2P74_08880 [Nitrosomonas sp.]|nr:hypothetical protein [Nitrosomonas sp.]
MILYGIIKKKEKEKVLDKNENPIAQSTDTSYIAADSNNQSDLPQKSTWLNNDL